MDDCVSREAVRKAYKHMVITGNMTTLINEVEALPPITPAEKIAHWVNNQNGTYTCDSCGCKHSRSRYCPNCGTKMEVQE